MLATIAIGLQGCSTPKAMDALWSSDLVDDNGLARNPVWSHMKQTGQPPDACSVCPCQTEDPQAWKAAANCTDQTLETNSSLECFGHWNWFPVEYEGHVTWGGHSNSLYDDDDYFMEVKRSDRSLETSSRDGLHIEFDSNETVDYWDDTNTWWDDFHHHYVDENDQAAHGRIDGKDVILIGLLGLDSRHDVHSELNPVYAMFVHVQDDAADDRWSFFVKNWGNEGYCGDNEEYLAPIRQNRIQIRIRHPGATGFTLNQKVFVYGDDEDERNQQSWTYQSVPGGALLTFWLRDASKQVGFVGDLVIKWTGGVAVVEAKPEVRTEPKIAPASTTQVAEEEGDSALKSRIGRLTPADQSLLHKQLKHLVHHTPAVPKPGTLALSATAEPVKPSGSIPDYRSETLRVNRAELLARRAKARELVLSFLKQRGID